MNNKLKWTDHVTGITAVAARDIFLLKRLAYHVRDVNLLINIFKRHIRPKLEYGCPIWNGLTIHDEDFLEKLQRRAIRIILNLPYRQILFDDTYSRVNLDFLITRRNYATACYGYKLFQEKTPRTLHNMKPMVPRQLHPTRNPLLYTIPFLPTPSLSFRRSPIQLATSLLNHVGPNYYNSPSMRIFKKQLTVQRHTLLSNFRIT